MLMDMVNELLIMVKSTDEKMFDVVLRIVNHLHLLVGIVEESQDVMVFVYLLIVKIDQECFLIDNYVVLEIHNALMENDQLFAGHGMVFDKKNQNDMVDNLVVVVHLILLNKKIQSKGDRS
jgi:hypothetical protein